SPAQIFDETLATLFNAPGGGQLYVENLKGVSGEVALRLGAENDAFGVINVGDDAKLVKLCEANGLATGEREFSGSLFHEINKPQSTVNLLIGSKKFTEGWSSWRVSTMGLMNVGKGEGAQIIQLFGRGVRLKGYDMSLKRSGKTQLPEGIDRPKHISVLETLGIFGIHADYMAQFRDFLEEEGLPTNDERVLFLLPVINNLGTQKLRTIRLKKTINGVSTEFGDAFRKLAPVPTLTKPDPVHEPSTDYLQKNQVVLNWYPKIQAMKSGGLVGGDAVATPNETHLSARHVAFLDLDRIYFELERFKAERGWYNLNLTRYAIEALLADQSWYRLLIPAEEMAFDSFEKVRLWDEIAVSLLKKYTERYYTFRKREWELPHLEYRNLENDDPNFLCVKESPDNGYYRILIDESQEEIVAKLNELKAMIEKGDLKPWEFRGMKAIWFGNHLYQPLLYLDSNIVEISPAPLNKGERQFVEDLKTYPDGNADFFKARELYLLRNLSKGRGVGFFEAGNFHPDFILWLLAGNQQQVIFVDPKGIRNLGPSDPKIQFYETVKEIEQRLANADVHLHSFIISNTPSFAMRMLWRMEKEEMQKRHILFQEEDRESYIRSMLDVAGAGGAV
ncbi:MAG: DEAD/DEAH box helicase, partial [bacterium]